MSTERDDMTGLRRTWKRRSQRVEQVKKRINTNGMTRSPRDPVESRWLRESGNPGPFDEVSP